MAAEFQPPFLLLGKNIKFSLDFNRYNFVCAKMEPNGGEENVRCNHNRQCYNGCFR